MYMCTMPKKKDSCNSKKEKLNLMNCHVKRKMQQGCIIFSIFFGIY